MSYACMPAFASCRPSERMPQDERRRESFDRRDPAIDLRDARFVRTPDEQYLSSISHLRLARSQGGVRFQTEAAPALAPANAYELEPV